MSREPEEIYFWGIFKAKEGYECLRFVSTAYRIPKGGWGNTKTLPGGSRAVFKDYTLAKGFLRQLGLSCYPRRKGDPKELLEVYV